MVGQVDVLISSSNLNMPACRAEYIEQSERTAFEEACTTATMQNVNDVLRPFFATWTTSLVGSDLEKLKSVSTEPRICALIEKLVI